MRRILGDVLFLMLITNDNLVHPHWPWNTSCFLNGIPFFMSSSSITSALDLDGFEECMVASGMMTTGCESFLYYV